MWSTVRMLLASKIHPSVQLQALKQLIYKATPQHRTQRCQLNHGQEPLASAQSKQHCVLMRHSQLPMQGPKNCPLTRRTQTGSQPGDAG